MATTAERNARLDALQSAVVAFAATERKRLTDQVARNKKILKGRTGATRLAQASADQAAELVVDEINQFLTG